MCSGYASTLTLSEITTPQNSFPNNSSSRLPQVEQILGDNPEVKEKLFSMLKQYAAEKKVEWLASVLPDVLTTDEHRQLISSIR